MNITKKLTSFFRDRNNKEISANILLTFLIKGGAMLISVLIVPAYQKYFGDDTVYGAWLTVSAVFTWINMFDFGIGNGLRNYLVKSIAAKDDAASKRYISSSYISVGMISLLLLGVGGGIIALLDWNTLLKIGTDVVDPMVFKVFMEVIFSGVVVHFFFLLSSSICYALQKTFLPGLISLITHVMLLLFLYVPNDQGIEGKIISLAITYFLSYNLPILLVTIWIFVKELKKARPSFKAFDMSSAKQVISLGGVFFIIQIALIALNSSNEIYINTFFRPEDVVQYTYYHKLFYILMVAITLVLQPIWSAVTKAYHEKRFGWIKKTYLVVNGISALLCLFAFLLALIYRPLADIWLGKGKLVFEWSTVLYFAIHTSMYIFCNANNSFSNGLGVLKCQTICSVCGAVLKLIFILLATQFIDNVSWSVVILANIIALLPMIIIHPIYLMKYINGTKRVDAKD